MYGVRPSIMGKFQVLTETNTLPALSIRAALKLPTGDESHLLGSGSPDYGLGLAMEKHVAKDWIVYANRISWLWLTITVVIWLLNSRTGILSFTVL